MKLFNWLFLVPRFAQCGFLGSVLGAVAGPIIGGIFGSDASKSAANTQANSAAQSNQVQLDMFNRSLDAQQKNFDRSQALTEGVYDTTRGNLAPYLTSGASGLFNLNYLLGNVNNGSQSDSTAAQAAGIYGGGPGGSGGLLRPFSLTDFKESPAYQFNLQQGQMAIEKAARRSGKSYAPSTLQDISKYSQGLADNEYTNAYNMFNSDRNNVYNKLYPLSGIGQNAATGLGGFGSNFANAESNLGSNFANSVGTLGGNYANQVGSNLQGAGNAQAAGQIGSANAISGGLSGAYNNYLMNQILSQNQQSSFGGGGGGNGGMVGDFSDSQFA